MIAGIIAFVAVATSVVFGDSCGGCLSNGCSGNVANVFNSGFNGGLLSSGLLRSSPIVSSPLVNSRLVSPIGGLSSLVATPSAVAPSNGPSVVSIGCSVTAPISQSFNTVVGTGSEVIPTEAVVPAYSTLATPVISPSFGSTATVPITSVSPIAPQFQSDISGLGSSPFAQSLVSAPAVSSGLFESPVLSSPAVVASSSSSPFLGSSISGSVFGSSSGSSGIIATPVVEQVNVATPIVSGGLVSSGLLGSRISSGNLFSTCNN